jgi:hypothetical protein
MTYPTLNRAAPALHQDHGADDEPLPVWTNVVARRFTQLRSRRRGEEPEQRRGLSELETNLRRRIGRHYATTHYVSA